MKYLVYIFFLLVTSFSWGHEYYFSFTEIEYNTASKKFEISIQTSAHDTEFALNKSGIAVKDLELQAKDSIVKKGLESWLNAGFHVEVAGKPLTLKMIGFEVLPNGQMYAYLESEPVETPDSLTINYPLLMDQFPLQQNKLTLIYTSLKQTAVFLPNKTVQTLKLIP
jgi:hypothetical protein